MELTPLNLRCLITSKSKEKVPERRLTDALEKPSTQALSFESKDYSENNQKTDANPEILFPVKVGFSEAPDSRKPWIFRLRTQGTSTVHSQSRF